MQPEKLSAVREGIVSSSVQVSERLLDHGSTNSNERRILPGEQG